MALWWLLRAGVARVGLVGVAFLRSWADFWRSWKEGLRPGKRQP